MIILGIDIGIQGAIAVIDQSSRLLTVEDLPVIRDGPKGRRAINAYLLADIINGYKNNINHAFIEGVWPRPANGPVQAFSFGRSTGIVEGVLAAAGVPVAFITPPAWKRIVGLAPGRDKDASRSEAIRRWPSHADLFKLKKHDGRAEACLIAVAGLAREHSPPVGPGATTSTWTRP